MNRHVSSTPGRRTSAAFFALVLILAASVPWVRAQSLLYGRQHDRLYLWQSRADTSFVTAVREGAAWRLEPSSARADTVWTRVLRQAAGDRGDGTVLWDSVLDELNQAEIAPSWAEMRRPDATIILTPVSPDTVRVAFTGIPPAQEEIHLFTRDEANRWTKTRAVDLTGLFHLSLRDSDIGRIFDVGPTPTSAPEWVALWDAWIRSYEGAPAAVRSIVYTDNTDAPRWLLLEWVGGQATPGRVEAAPRVSEPTSAPFVPLSLAVLMILVFAYVVAVRPFSNVGKSDTSLPPRAIREVLPKRSTRTDAGLPHDGREGRVLIGERIEALYDELVANGGAGMLGHAASVADWIDRLPGFLERQRTRIDELEAVVESLQMEKETLLAERKRQESRLESTQARNRELVARDEQLTNELSEARDENSFKQHEITRLEQRIDEIELGSKHMEEAIDEISSVIQLSRHIHMGTLNVADRYDEKSGSIVAFLANYALFHWCLGIIDGDSMRTRAMQANLVRMAQLFRSESNGFLNSLQQMQEMGLVAEGRDASHLLRADRLHDSAKFFQKLLHQIRTQTSIDLGPFYYDVDDAGVYRAE